jgi:hypothetical protein
MVHTALIGIDAGDQEYTSDSMELIGTRHSALPYVQHRKQRTRITVQNYLDMKRVGNTQYIVERGDIYPHQEKRRAH